MEKEEEIFFRRDIARWNDAFIFTTSFSYISALIASLFGYPMISPTIFPVLVQVILYLSMFLLLLISFFNRRIRWAIAAGYGFSAMLSFSGLQPWVSYLGNSSLLGPAMAAWDLILAIALLTKY